MAHSPSLGVSFSAPRVFAAEMISPDTAQLHGAKGRGSKAGAGAGTGAGAGVEIGVGVGVGASPASWVREVVDSCNQAVLRPLWLSDLKMKDMWGPVSTESRGVPSSSPDLSPEGHWTWPRVSTRTPDPPPPPDLAPGPSACCCRPGVMSTGRRGAGLSY